MSIDTQRVWHQEQDHTWTKDRLDELLGEIDRRLNSSNCFPIVFRDANDLINKIEYYSEASHTNKIAERTFTRSTGTDNVEYITGIVTIFYNDDSSEDSRITTTITRDPTDNWITSCDNVFSTSETPPC